MSVESIKKFEAFRLSAVLYADNNYEVNPKTILRKIIESVFIDNDNRFKNVDDIVEEIESTYDLVFSDLEITEVLKKNKDKHFLINERGGELSACLTYVRNDLLKKKIHHKNIGYFLERFTEIYADYPISDQEVKEVIYRFLYEVFSTNIASFNKLIDSRIDVDDVIGTLNYNFRNQESVIINDFLKWENDDKNKAIFDISNFALEYCLISNKKPDSLFHVKNLKNKNFYLDTNVIFRGIGINGSSRKKRTITFLSKFKEANEKLLISKYTEDEFFSTISHYVADIGKNISPRINSSVFLQFSRQSELYNYYFEWKNTRSNDNLNLFLAHLESLYEEFKKKYDIQVVNKLEFDESDDQYLEALKVTADSIFSNKRLYSHNPDRISYKSIEIDAKNIALIDKIRGNRNKNIFETKDFLISTDQQLKKWDMGRGNMAPVVLLPSQWLTILLRYHNRTNDDFKSFVSFLNLSSSENTIPNRTLTTILNGISEITIDAEKQSFIVSKLIENKFKDIINNDQSEDEIEEFAKDYAKSTLEKRLEELENKAEKFESIIDEKAKLIQEKEEVINKSFAEQELKESNSAVLISSLVKTQLETWKSTGYWFLAVSILCSIIFIFIFIDEVWNPVYHLKLAINNLPSDSTEKDSAKTALYGVSAVGSITFFVLFFNRVLNKDNIRNKEDDIKMRIKEEN